MGLEYHHVVAGHDEGISGGGVSATSRTICELMMTFNVLLDSPRTLDAEMRDLGLQPIEHASGCPHAREHGSAVDCLETIREAGQLVRTVETCCRAN